MAIGDAGHRQIYCHVTQPVAVITKSHSQPCICRSYDVMKYAVLISLILVR